MTFLSSKPALRRGLRAAARVTAGLVMLFVGLVLVSGGLGAAGMRRDSLDCTTLPPPAGIKLWHTVAIAVGLLLTGVGVLFPSMHGRDWTS